MENEELFFLLDNLKNWCAYQERCQQDVLEKIKSYKRRLSDDEINGLIAQLIAENFINEERYAIAFASGKFRIKRWGRIKISTMLKVKRISDYSINRALDSIENNDYERVVNELLEKKKRELKSETNKIRLNYKLLKFLQSRGFETDIVVSMIK